MICIKLTNVVTWHAQNWRMLSHDMHKIDQRSVCLSQSNVQELPAGVTHHTRAEGQVQSHSQWDAGRPCECTISDIISDCINLHHSFFLVLMKTQKNFFLQNQIYFERFRFVTRHQLLNYRSHDTCLLHDNSIVRKIFVKKVRYVVLLLMQDPKQWCVHLTQSH